MSPDVHQKMSDWRSKKGTSSPVERRMQVGARPKKPARLEARKMRKVTTGTIALGGLVGLVGTMGMACGGAPPEAHGPAAPAAAAAATPAAPSCARARPGVGAVRADELRQGGAVTLARLGGKTIAYVADED